MVTNLGYFKSIEFYLLTDAIRTDHGFENISTIIPTDIRLIFYPLFSCWCPQCMAQEYLITTF